MVTKSIKSKLLVLLGPTSTGKTDIALQLAKKFNGELVACDSRQVYKDLDIGTGKLPGSGCIISKGDGWWEMNGIKVWMYDVIKPTRQYTVFNYIKDASRVVDDIIVRGKLPMLTAGTGLYLKALLEGLPNLAVPIDLRLRKNLEKLSLNELQKKLQKISPQKWERLNSSDRQNPRRLLRAIEIGTNVVTNDVTKGLTLAADILKIGLTAPREVLYQRIDERVVERIEQGMIEEAGRLHKAGLTLARMRQLGLEYRIMADYLEDKIQGSGNLIKILQGKIHGYARRQMTWFKREKDVFWFDITDSSFSSKVENLVAKWYYLADGTQN
jgi:tRNA dimethylallyltransferase